MNAKYISLAFAAAATLFAGCAKSPLEEVKSSGQLTDLELSHVGSTEVKSVIDGTTFPTEGEIGLFLFADEQAKQAYGTGYKNIKYSYNSDKKKWTASPAIKVGSTPGYLYGYYPYDSESKNIKAIPVASSLNGDDVMYASKQAEAITDKTAANTSITMNHALARVAITVINKGYTGNAKLSQIKFEGAKIAGSGTLDATSGSITATKADDVTLSVPEAAQTITKEGTVYECLMVPSGEDKSKQSVTLTLTIDGNNKTAILSGNDNGVIIAQGTKSNITITLSNTGIAVLAVSVEEWSVAEVGGHKVKVELSEEEDGIDDDVVTRLKVKENTVEILAYSLSGVRLECILTGEAEVSRDMDILDGTFTFTISDIDSDVTATIGYVERFDVTVTSNNPEWGSATFEGECYKGETITFTATANDGFEFIEWQDADGNKLDWENPQKVTLTSDLAVKAVFEISGILPGVFTVGKGSDGIAGTADDVKVRFSKGNLYYDSYNKTFHFESNQYDVIYKHIEREGYEETEDHIGHFYWSSEESSACTVSPFQPKDISLTEVFFTNDSNDQTKPNPDFCANKLKGYWRVLSGNHGNGEWAYILNDRDGNRFARAKVHDRAGLLIFPDGYTLPSGYSPDGGTGMSKVNVNGKDEMFPSDNIPDDDGNKVWSEMEAAGVVFLPAAGYRDGYFGPSKYILWAEYPIDGHYWTSSPHRETVDDAYYCYFTDIDGVGLSTFLRDNACSVRLVIDCR